MHRRKILLQLISGSLSVARKISNPAKSGGAQHQDRAASDRGISCLAPGLALFQSCRVAALIQQLAMNSAPATGGLFSRLRTVGSRLPCATWLVVKSPLGSPTQGLVEALGSRRDADNRFVKIARGDMIRPHSFSERRVAGWREPAPDCLHDLSRTRHASERRPESC